MNPSLRLVPAGLALIGVSYGLARFAYGLFLPSIRDAVDLTPTIAGWIGSGAYAGYCVAIIASALLVERTGPRLMAVAAGLTATIGMALIALSYSPGLLAFAVLLAGTSTGLASPPMAQAVAQIIPHTRQARANTLINSGTSVGVMLSGPIALMALGQWRTAYFVFAAIAAVTTLWVAFTVPGRRRGASSEVIDTDTTDKKRSQSIVRIEAIPMVLAATGMGFASAAYWTFAGEMIVDVGHFSHRLSSIAWVVIGITGLAGGLAGDLIQRVGVNTVHRSFLAALAVAMLGLAIWPSQLIAVLLSAALFGAAYIMLTGVYLVWGIRVYDDRPAVGLGLAFLMIAIGQVVGTPVAGMLIEATSHPLAFVVFAGFALAPMLSGHRPETSCGTQLSTASGPTCSSGPLRSTTGETEMSNRNPKQNPVDPQTQKELPSTYFFMPAMPPLGLIHKIETSIRAWRRRRQLR